MRTLAAALLLAAPRPGQARVYDLERDFGAVPYSASHPATAQSKVAWANGAAFNTSLSKLAPGDTLVVPNKTFHLVGGIVAKDVADVTISFDGTLVCEYNNGLPQSHLGLTHTVDQTRSRTPSPPPRPTSRPGRARPSARAGRRAR